MIGYKAFNKDLTCRDFQYEIGKTYTMDEEPILCERGFHFCDDFLKVFQFYDYFDNIRVCKVKAEPSIAYEHDLSKYVTNNITILEEITDVKQFLIDTVDFRCKNPNFVTNNSYENIQIIKNLIKSDALVGEDQDNLYFSFNSFITKTDIYNIQSYLDSILSNIKFDEIKNIASEWFIPSEYEVFGKWINGNRSFDKAIKEIYLPNYLKKMNNTYCWLRSTLKFYPGTYFCFALCYGGGVDYANAGNSFDIMPVFTVPKINMKIKKFYLKN